jgi:site-specific DNA-methyltransferase (adenine-specific)
MNRTLLEGDALHKLQEIDDNSVDLITTDPSYGYSFMNKDWDKALASVDIWKECLRVLKPGAFAFVMSAPRQDVLSHMIVNLSDAGFKTDFTSIYWAYSTGFPKAANTSKLVDKKLGLDREVIGTRDDGVGKVSESGIYKLNNMESKMNKTVNITEPTSPQAKKLDGSYAGFQPKPAVEVILVCMKPLSEKSYTEQAMKNGKGIVWFDDVRIPYKNENLPKVDRSSFELDVNYVGNDYGKYRGGTEYIASEKGRFPANLLVSDNALNDGKITKNYRPNSTGKKYKDVLGDKIYGEYKNETYTFNPPQDSGSFSRYFDLDAWAQFIITPKPSKSEKNKGLDNFIEHKVSDGRTTENDTAFQRGKTQRQNTHPTVKPITLFKYLITMGSREGDLILDPFMGSGTTAIACEQIARDWIGIEKEPEYVEICKARLAPYINQNKMEEFL